MGIPFVGGVLHLHRNSSGVPTHPAFASLIEYSINEPAQRCIAIFNTSKHPVWQGVGSVNPCALFHTPTVEFFCLQGVVK
jgi:hypothetical protein